MVRLQGEIYAWSVAAPLVLGWAAFGAWWPHLLPADSVGAAVGAGRWAPPSGLSPMNSGVVSEPTAAPIGDDKKVCVLTLAHMLTLGTTRTHTRARARTHTHTHTRPRAHTRPGVS